jgi:hypothetical protein
MRLFGWVLKRARVPNHDFSEEEREEGSAAGVEARQAIARRKAMIRRLDDMEQTLQMEERLARLEGYIGEMMEGGEEEESSQGFDGLLQQILMKKLLAGGASGAPSGNVSIPPAAPQTERLEDAAIKENIAQLPRTLLRSARKMPDETLRQYLKKNTVYDEDTITRAVQLFRSEKF